MAGFEGIEFNEITVGNLLGKYKDTASREEILRYIKNTGIHEEKFVYENELIVPPAMIFVFTLRSIFSSKIPVEGAILAGHELECIDPIKSGENLNIDIVIKDKYIKKDRKYVLINFVIKGDDEKIKCINTMKAIWPK